MIPPSLPRGEAGRWTSSLRPRSRRPRLGQDGGLSAIANHRGKQRAHDRLTAARALCLTQALPRIRHARGLTSRDRGARECSAANRSKRPTAAIPVIRQLVAAPPPPAIQQKINLIQQNKVALGASAGFSRSHSGQSTLSRFASNFHKLIKTPVPFRRIGSDALLMHFVSARCRGLRHGDCPPVKCASLAGRCVRWRTMPGVQVAGQVPRHCTLPNAVGELLRDSRSATLSDCETPAHTRHLHGSPGFTGRGLYSALIERLGHGPMRQASNRKPKATARRWGRRETIRPGAVRPCGEEPGGALHRT